MSSNNVYLIASSMVRVGRYFSKSYKDLVVDVVNELFSSVGSIDIDYLIISNVFSDSILEQLDISTILTQELGLTPKPALRVETGESSGLTAITQGYSLIKSGIADTVLVVGVEKCSEFPTPTMNKHFIKFSDYEVESIYGLSVVNEAALLMKIYMRRYGYSREDLSSWSVKMHSNALKNPYAQLRFLISKEQVVRSQVISDPIRLLDMYPVGDGASAVLLSSKEGIVNNEALEVVDIAQATSQPLNLREDLLSLPATKTVFNKLLSRSKLDLNDLVIEVHDSYSILGYLILEELGLVEKGKAPSIIDDLDNVNLSGGLKARGHPIGATGVYQVAEVFKIMTTGLGDIKRCSCWGLIHSMSAVDNNSVGILVRRCSC